MQNLAAAEGADTHKEAKVTSYHNFRELLDEPANSLVLIP
jgi:hypothetical protein